MSSAAPTWDLSRYFDRFEGEDYVAFDRALGADLDALLPRLAALPPITAASVGDWADALLVVEEITTRLRHLSSYLGCLGSADVRVEAVQRARAKLSGTQAKFRQRFVQVEAAFKVTSDEDFERLVRDPSLESARHTLERVREQARRSMTADLEGLAAELEVNGMGAFGRLYTQVAGSLSFDLVRGDRVERVPMSMRNSLLSNADPAIRASAFDGGNVAWRGVSHVAAAALNAIAGTRLALYKRRGIGHFLEPALFDSNITRRTLDAMLEAVHAARELPRRYLRAKAPLIGQKRLRACDLAAPLPLPQLAKVDWATGSRRVREAFDRVYPALGAYTARAYEARWIDAEPREGKSPGGFCSSSPFIGESRIFMTYHDAPTDVRTLAHELGHAFHNDVMRDLRTWQRGYPMTLAETASTFAETVFSEAILADPATTDVERLDVLDTRLEQASAFLLNIPMRYQFEHALYTERAHGELSPSRLVTMMLEAQRDWYGDALEPDSLDPMFWASKLHFYITSVSFYNFPYTFGYLFSLAIYERARAEGPAFLRDFESLLRQTGSASAEAIARDKLGCDLEDPAFWESSIAVVEADLDRFLALAPRVIRPGSASAPAV